MAKVESIMYLKRRDFCCSFDMLLHAVSKWLSQIDPMLLQVDRFDYIILLLLASLPSRRDTSSNRPEAFFFFQSLGKFTSSDFERVGRLFVAPRRRYASKLKSRRQDFDFSNGSMGLADRIPARVSKR